jgi:hypothetical protein
LPSAHILFVCPRQQQAAGSMASKRIMKELDDLKKDPPASEWPGRRQGRLGSASLRGMGSSCASRGGPAPPRRGHRLIRCLLPSLPSQTAQQDPWAMICSTGKQLSWAQQTARMQAACSSSQSTSHQVRLLLGAAWMLQRPFLHRPG